jgi:hypothetical protein
VQISRSNTKHKPRKERKRMNNVFHELTKQMAQSVTRRAALKKFGVGLAGITLARFGLNRAQAITNGQLDGDAHPNVGVGVFLQSIFPPTPAPMVCGSGTLIHPRVFLTAGHATNLLQTLLAGGGFSLSDMRLSFGSNALDPASWRTVSNVLTHPDYATKAQTENGRGTIPLPDVGVVVLRDPVGDIVPAALPPLGFLDGLQASGMLRTGSQQAKFTVVGYGVGLGDPVGHVPFPPDGLRRVTQSEFLNLHDRWLVLSQNPAQGNGGGGDCDSGGPLIWVDPSTGTTTLVATTSRGDQVNRALSVNYRVDTSEALSFLSDIILQVNAGGL